MRRFWTGAAWGAVATVAMSVLMLLGVASGASPMPKPIPAAIVGKLTGGMLAKPTLMATAALLHLGYGAFWGGVLATLSPQVKIGRGLALGVLLWLLMQVLVLPFLGWGAFGAAVTPKIAVATLVLHLVYGGTLGALLDRQPAATSARASAGLPS